MTDDLPFVGVNCPHCGGFCPDEQTLTGHICFLPREDIATRLRRLVIRWVPRVQQAEALRELEDEIGIARKD